MLLYILLCIAFAGEVIDITKYGAVSNKKDLATAQNNTFAIQMALEVAQPGDIVLIPNSTFHALGQITATNMKRITIKLDGTLVAYDDTDNWPKEVKKDGTFGNYLPFIYFANSSGLTVTSSGIGVIDGMGKTWWNAEVFFPSRLNGSKRPCLFVMDTVQNVVVENIHMINSPRFHLDIANAENVELSHVHVLVDRQTQRKIRSHRRKVIWDPTLVSSVEDMVLQPEDLNTDGFDLSGRNFWVHDCRVTNDDDSVAVKPCAADFCDTNCTENILIERTTLIGFGASIGSVPPRNPAKCVRNVTFRDIQMPNTGKGVYIKSNPTCDASDPDRISILEDITYENINITNPRWWAIWIGPQQQHEPHDPLGGKCALFYPLVDSCPTQGCATFNNIVLRNISIHSPLMSPGVILGNKTNPMTNIIFDNVQTTEGSFPLGRWPWGDEYKCEHATIQSLGNTNPVPKCKQ